MRDREQVVFVLLLVQAGATLLAMLGELLFMAGLPFYAVVPLLRVALTAALAAMILRRQRGAAIGVIVLQGISLAGFAASAVVGVTPQVDFTPTLTGVFTGVVLPVVLILLCARLVVAWKPSSTA